jgi:DNA recombination protein RmuC
VDVTAAANHAGQATPEIAPLAIAVGLEQLQRDHRVTLAGPTTLAALLNALQMGFCSVAIERRSSEVWQVLGAVRTEFTKYNDVVERIGKQLGSAANSVEALGVRTRAMSRKLRGVETLPEAEAAMLLGFEQELVGGRGGTGSGEVIVSREKCGSRGP